MFFISRVEAFVQSTSLPESFQIETFFLEDGTLFGAVKSRTGDPRTEPQKALRGGIPCSFLEPFWGIYRQKLTKSSKNDF